MKRGTIDKILSFIKQFNKMPNEDGYVRSERNVGHSVKTTPRLYFPFGEGLPRQEQNDSPVILAAFDCDGTLKSNRGDVGRRTIGAIADFKSRGLLDIYATGKSPAALAEPIRAIYRGDSESILYVAYNGAKVRYVVRLSNGDKTPLIKEYKLSPEATRVVIEFFKGLKDQGYVKERGGITINQFLDPLLLGEDPSNVSPERAKGVHALQAAYLKINPGLEYHQTDFGGSLESHKIMILTRERELTDRIMEEIGKFSGKWPQRLAISTERSGANYIEIKHRKATKKNGLKIVAEYHGIDLARSIAFGDQDNDASMLSAVGMGLAVSNASELAKKVSKYVLPFSNDQDAVGKALEVLLSDIDIDQEFPTLHQNQKELLTSMREEFWSNFTI